MVTPRIIGREEEVVIQTGYTPPASLPEQVKTAPSMPTPAKCCESTATTAPCKLKAVACWQVPSRDSCQRCSSDAATCTGDCCASQPTSSNHVTQVLEIYRQACANGQVDLAKKLAILAIDMDPTCFNK